MIYQVDIHTDRENYIVHLQDEETMYFIIPMENDNSDEWGRLQDWLDQGNVITDTIEYRQDYIGKRKTEYPPIEEFADAWVKQDEEALEEYRQKCLNVKTKYPKPE